MRLLDARRRPASRAATYRGCTCERNLDSRPHQGGRSRRFGSGPCSSERRRATSARLRACPSPHDPVHPSFGGFHPPRRRVLGAGGRRDAVDRGPSPPAVLGSGDVASWLAPGPTAAVLQSATHWPDPAQRLMRGAAVRSRVGSSRGCSARCCSRPAGRAGTVDRTLPSLSGADGNAGAYPRLPSRPGDPI